MAMETNVDVVLGIIGALLCLGGWVLFHVGSRLVGITIGMGFGFAFGSVLALILQLQPAGEQLVLLSCSLMGAIVGFFFVKFATTFLFALIGFLFGALLGRVGSEVHASITGSAYGLNTPVAIGIAVSGFVVALLAVWLQKLILIVITSFVGATFLTAAMPNVQKVEVWVLLGIFSAALMWQFILARIILRSKPSAAED